MLQTIRCKFQGCGYCSKSGFCLNRLTVINDQGVCEYLTKPGWDQQIKEDWMKNTYVPPIEEEEEEETLAIEEKKGPTVDDILSGKSTQY